MDAVLRSATIYVFLLVLLRATGKRTLAQITTFDFVLLLVLGEATQQGLLGDDFSVTNAILVITTLVGLDLGLSLWKQRSPRLGRLTDGTPLVIVEDGTPLRERMDRCRLDDADVLAAARETQGLARMEEIAYAVLERSGGISVVAKRQQ